jgi:Ca2+/Na+ antiporter
VALPERFNLRSLYLYLVCLITLVVSIFAAVQFVRSTVSLLYPDPGYYGYYYESPDADRTEAEQARQEELARDSQRRQSVLDMVGGATTLLIAGPLYVYHWRRVQAELPSRVPPAASS